MNVSLSVHDFRQSVKALLWLFMMCVVFPHVACADSNAATAVRMTLDQAHERWSGFNAKQKFSVISQLISSGRYGDAERFLLRSHFGTAEEKVTSQFFLGMAYKGQGRLAEAIATFRDILTDNPQFIEARLALAQALFDKQDDEAAKHHFELVSGESDRQPGLAQLARSYIDAIDRRRRWDFSFYVTAAPSTNFNQGSENRVVILNGLPFILSDANIKQSGVGLATGFHASYRYPLTDRFDLVASGGMHTKRYKESDYNVLFATGSFGPRYRFNWGTIGLYATANKRWHADTQQHSIGLGGLLSAQARLTPFDQLSADLYCSKRRFDDDFLGSDLTYQDGHVCGVGASLDHYFDSVTFVRALGSVGTERTRLEHLDNTSWSAGAGIYRELPFGITLYLQGLYSNRDYDGVFPGSTSVRRDNRYDLSAQITKRDWDIFGFAPQVVYTYTKNQSNVSFFVYDAHGVNVTLTKKF